MADFAIRVEDLGKKYIIGHQDEAGYGTFRDAIAGGLRRIGQAFKPDTPVLTNVVLEEFWALRNVSLEIEHGEVVGIIGRNGAGKSTFLKLLSRITEPTTGRIDYVGKVATLLEVGTGFHPELTGRENIFLNGAILGMSGGEIRAKFDEIVAFAEIEKFLDTPVKRYSSGMYVRLAFAVAAHLEPDILLVDEVLAVGDSAFQKKCLGKMKDVATREGRTVLFVSHNMQAVQALCGRAVQFDRGALADEGDVRSVVGRYLSKLSSTESVRFWNEEEAPGDKDIKLRAVKVTSGGDTGGVYGSSAEIAVEIAFDAASVPAGLCVGFDMVTPEAVTVLRSYQTDLPEQEWPETVPGRNTWLCRIPPGLLNAGTYYLCPKIGVHNVYWIANLDSVVQFEIQLDHGVSPFWNSLNASNRPGVVAPILPWEILPETILASR